MNSQNEDPNLISLQIQQHQPQVLKPIVQSHVPEYHNRVTTINSLEGTGEVDDELHRLRENLSPKLLSTANYEDNNWDQQTSEVKDSSNREPHQHFYSDQKENKFAMAN